MSSTYESTNGDTYFFNSDFSGEVTIVSPDFKSVKVDGKGLIELVVLCYLIPNKISKLEQAGVEDFLGE